VLRHGGAQKKLKLVEPKKTKKMQCIVAILRCALTAGVTTLFVKRLKPKLQVTNTLEVLSSILERAKQRKWRIPSFMWVSGKESQERRSATKNSE
jgi:hypothetical protein